MTATILYCIITLLIGLLLTIAVAETWIYARPRVIGWLKHWLKEKYND